MFLWLWGLLGLGLVSAALFSSLIDFLIPGLAALVLAVLNLLPFFNTALPLQFAVWLVVSGAGIVLFRHFFGGLVNTGGGARDKEVVGKTAQVVEALDGVQAGRVHFEGTTWAARSEEAIPVGKEVIVLGRDGLTLFVALSEHDRIEEAFKALEK
ncbi:MAG: NfeD family protein [Spirochaetales bacterium]|nr:NfeD family protein [Spirochaetales bacterium]